MTSEFNDNMSFETLFIENDLNLIEDILSTSTPYQSNINDVPLSPYSSSILQLTDGSDSQGSDECSEPLSKKRKQDQDKKIITNNDKVSNPSRKRRQMELIMLREQVTELQKRYDNLSDVLYQRANNVLSCESYDNIWKRMAIQQKEQVRLAKLNNISLRTKLQQQTSILQMIQGFLQQKSIQCSPHDVEMPQIYPRIQAISLMSPLAENRNALLARLQQLVMDTDSFLEKCGLANANTTRQLIQMEAHKESGGFCVIGSTLIVTPVPISVAHSIIWSMYNLHTLTQPLNTGRPTFNQTIAHGLTRIRNGLRIVDGTIIAHQEVLSDTKTRIIVEYSGHFQPPYGFNPEIPPGFTVHLQETSWIVLESTPMQDMVFQSEPSESTVVRWGTALYLRSTLGDEKFQLPKFLSNKLLSTVTKILKFWTLQFENEIIDTIRQTST